MKISNMGLKKYKNYSLFDFKSIFHFFSLPIISFHFFTLFSFSHIFP